MPLIQRLGTHHSIQEFRAAALARFREAKKLGSTEDRLAAIYLGGYCVEMLLKAAYFRLAGRGPADAITLADMYAAQAHATGRLGLPWPGKNLHDLTRWAALLIEERRALALAYPAGFSRSLMARVQRVYLNWREHLRYRANRPYIGEVAAVLHNAQWLLGQFRFL